MANWKKLNYKIIGEAPLLEHNGSLADPLNKITKLLKKISSKKIKTDSDHEEMARLEFLGSVYTEGGKVIIPSAMIESSLVNAARAQKKGKVALGALFCDKNALLNYSGEQDVEKRSLLEDCRYRAAVVVSRARIMRTRPIFKDWSADIELNYNTEQIDLEDLKTIILKSGENGIGDYRPKFGRFTVEFL